MFTVFYVAALLSTPCCAGGHTMTQQINTLEALYPNMAPNGASGPRTSCESHAQYDHGDASCLTSTCLLQGLHPSVAYRQAIV